MAKKTVYLDHSATTPTDPRVVEVMLPYFTESYGNAVSIHSFGRKAEMAIEDARCTIAGILNCKPAELVFTSCGSESDNLAVRGAAWWAKQAGRGNHLITTPIEHSAIIRTIEQLAEMMGFEQTILPVDESGAIRPEDFAAACRKDTTLASIMYANNEVGSIQPIQDLTAIAHEHDVLFHTDAVQAAGQLSLDVQALDVDMMSISAHKFYGPKGVGALYIREGIDPVPSQSGGSHERGRRAGTHNTPLIVGMAKALELAYSDLDEHIAHYEKHRDMLIEGILGRIPEAQLTGNAENRLPCHASFVFPGLDGNKLLMHLDMKGVAGSSASACKSGNPSPSDVLLAMGYDRETALSSLRLTVGRQTTEEDIHYAIDVIEASVNRMKKLKEALAQ